jgi:hypothetical protein
MDDAVAAARAADRVVFVAVVASCTLGTAHEGTS